MKLRYLRVIAAALVVGAMPCLAALGARANPVPDYTLRLESLLREAMREQHIPGALVFVDDPRRGRWMAALGSADLSGAPMPLDGYVRIGSITKTFTAASVLRLADRDVIELDTPIEHYLPKVVPNGAKITIRQLLNMTAGLFNNTEDCALNQRLDRNPELVLTPRQSLAIAFNHAPYFKPGTSYHYSNTNYFVLGLLLEKVTGMPLAKVYRQLLFEPLGMRHTLFPGLSDSRLPSPHPRGYLYGTNVQSLNALLAALNLDFLNSAVYVAPGAGPVDATNWNPSPYWAAGAAISTLHDLAIWAKAYGTGALLKPETYRNQIALLPGFTYGLGIAEAPRGFLGHDGALPGYSSIVVYAPERHDDGRPRQQRDHAEHTVGQRPAGDQLGHDHPAGVVPANKGAANREYALRAGSKHGNTLSGRRECERQLTGCGKTRRVRIGPDQAGSRRRGGFFRNLLV